MDIWIYINTLIHSCQQIELKDTDPHLFFRNTIYNTIYSCYYTLD